MAGNALVNIKFAADLKNFSSSVQNASRSIKKLGRQMQSAGSTLSLGLTAPFAAFSAVALRNFDVQQKGIAQLNAGLQSTGRYTDELSKKLQQQASELQNNSLFGDEDILKNSTAQILSFTNIATDAIPRVNQIVADLATRLGTDLKSNAISVSKALNAPLQNLSALGRSGIQFSEDQKKMIKSLVETNRLAEAQNVILTELETQYSGSAKAAAEAGTGWLKQLSNSIGDLTEDFGVHINEALKPFGEAVKGVVQRIQAWSPETKKMALVIGGLAAALGPLLVTLGLLMTNVIPGLITAFGAVKIAFTSLTTVIAANPLGALAVAIGVVAGAFLLFNNSVKDTVAQQNILADVNNVAAKSIANEKAKLQELLFIAQNENIQKSARIKAVKELNKLSPKYLGDLTLEKINTDKAREAVELYNTQLLKTAKIKAAQTKLQELQAKIIDIELAKENNSVEIAKEQLKVQETENLTVAQKNKLLAVTNKNKELASILTSKELEDLKNQEQQLLKIIAANKTLNSITTETVKPNDSKNVKPTASGLDLTGLQQGLDLDFTTGLDQQAEKLDATLTNMQQSFVDFSEQASQVVNQSVSSILGGFGSLIGGLITGASGLSDFKNLLLGSLAGMLEQLGQIAIQVGIGLKAIKAAFKSLNPFVAIAAGIGLIAFGKVIRSQIKDVGGKNFAGAFAEGGVVGGSSFTGDRLFARVNSGEMILNKRQQSNLAGMLNPAGAVPVNVTLMPSVDIVGDKFRVLLNRVDKRNSRLGYEG